MDFKLYADMLRNVPIHSVEQFEHFLNATSSESSRTTPSSNAKSNKPKKVSSLLDLIQNGLLHVNVPPQSRKPDPNSCSIEMGELSPKEQNKRKNSCQSAFEGCDRITVEAEIHDPLCSTLSEGTTFTDLARARMTESKPAAPNPKNNA
jgi:hypothetical protein